MDMEEFSDLFLKHREIISNKFVSLKDVSMGSSDQLIELVSFLYGKEAREQMISKIDENLATACKDKIYFKYSIILNSDYDVLEQIIVHELFHQVGFNLNSDLVNSKIDSGDNFIRRIMNEGVAMYGQLNYEDYDLKENCTQAERDFIINHQNFYCCAPIYSLGYFYFQENAKKSDLNWDEFLLEFVKKNPTVDEFKEFCEQYDNIQYDYPDSLKLYGKFKIN